MIETLKLVCALTFLTLVSVSAQAQTADQIAAYEQRIEEQQRQLDAMRAELEELKRLAGVVDEVAAADQSAAKAEAIAPMAEPAVERGPFVLRRSGNGELKLGGRLHRVLMNVDDGLSSTRLFIDSDQGPTMLRADISNSFSDELTLAGALEIGIQANRSFRVSQDEPNPGTDILVRIGEVVADHKRYGKLSFGRGFAAAWVAPEADLSGTVPAALLPVGMFSPSLKFAGASTNQLSDIRVNQHFIDVERLLLTDRIRYDSPQFAGGARVSTSLAPDNRWDAALRYYPTTENWLVRSFVTYQHKPFPDVDDRVDLGFSARHKGSGLSLTAAWANTKLINGRDANSYVLKGGWLTDLNSLGSTAFSLDYFVGEDQRLAGDKAQSIGFFALQKWQAVGVDLYGGYRIYDVSRSDIALKDLNALALGLIYTF